MPNALSTLQLQSFAVPIDSVEKVTGINFFPALPVNQEQAIVKTVCISCWSWSSTTTQHKTTQHKSTQASSKQVGKVQCSAITNSGSRCKRMTSNASGLCYQNEK